MNRHTYLFALLMLLPSAPAAAREKEITNSLGMRMVPVPAGTFQMGSPENEKGREEQELRHQVVLTKGYYLGMHEVTVGQFRRFVEAAKYQTEAGKDGKGGWGVNQSGSFEENRKFTWKAPGFEQSDDHPVVLVSWNDAVAFCRWLSQKEKATYRLPSEAEWEYSCRAGRETAYHFGNDPRSLIRYGNLFHHPSAESKDGYRFSAPVGRFKPNGHGFYDMLGNVWEWCEDGYDPKGYSGKIETDPTGPASAKARVQRGGGWSSAPHRCRSAARIGRDPSSYRGAYLGFRVVREK